MNKKYEIGEQIETQIVAVTGDTVFIDVGEKSEGIIDSAEFTDENGNVTVSEGSKIKAYFVSDSRGELRFTTKLSGEAAEKAGREIIERAFENKIPIEGKVEREIKGGFEVSVGSIRSFCPYSQMGGREREEASSYIGRVMTFLIAEYRDDGKSIVLSNRAYIDAQEKEKRAELSAKLKVGSIVNGTVASIKNYGAFIDIGGFQALLPVSEISYDRVADVASVLSVGKKITAKIISADWQAERVSLSMKALVADPWKRVAEKFSVGQKISGKISRVADFGIFVNLTAGIDGLVHISKLVGTDGITQNTNLKKKYKAGETFDAVIEKIEGAEKRISLSPATSSEQDQTTAQYMAAQEDSDNGETYNPFAALLKKK